jgi:hypothetical protein
MGRIWGVGGLIVVTACSSTTIPPLFDAEGGAPSDSGDEGGTTTNDGGITQPDGGTACEVSPSPAGSPGSGCAYSAALAPLCSPACGMPAYPYTCVDGGPDWAGCVGVTQHPSNGKPAPVPGAYCCGSVQCGRVPTYDHDCTGPSRPPVARMCVGPNGQLPLDPGCVLILDAGVYAGLSCCPN